MKQLLVAVTAALAALAATLAGSAVAQTFPQPGKPVRVIIPFPPGGPSDALGRSLADGLAKLWSSPVVAENRPGANLIIGSDYVAKSPGDGHTLLLANDPALSINQYLYSKLPYDPVKDLVPVAGLATTTLILLTKNDLPARNLREFIALAKQQGGKLTYGSIGLGSITHLDSEAFATAAGAKFTHVPYKGTGEVLPAITAGTIDFALSAPGAAVPFVKGGKMRALGVTDTARSPLLPEVPTFAEGGLPFLGSSWFGVAAPSSTPRAIVERLGADIRRVADSAEYRERFIAGYGLDPLQLGPDQFAAYLTKDRAKFAERVKNANVKLD